ncbi:MAG: ACP S-malonyltransferase [Richelia sp. RM1_1_1]|nr:ACP S-malonyltransferase [Richelia sp. RM1_1_1]
MEQVKQARYALVFPGQGSQYIGMGLEISEEFPSADKIFQSAEQITNLAIRNISFSGPEEDLMETSITQPCLLTTSIAFYTVFQEHFSLKPEFICGHSAGEYAALVAAGVLSFTDAIRLIQVRGSLMSKMQKGGMVALKGITLQEAEELCRQNVQTGGALVPANLNSPEQFVISGDDASVEAAIVFAFENNIKAIPLAVSGAFHSPLMQKAAKLFANETHNVRFYDATESVISNVTAEPVINGHEWMRLLSQQMTSSVRWESSIRYVQQQGIEIFVEVGPGQILSKLINKIVPSALILNIEDINSLQTTVAKMNEIFKAQLV